MNKIYIILLTLSIIYAQEFNQGPYGSDYFDIAGPFSVEDLNNNDTILGDVNYDLTLNIADVIIVIGIVLDTINNDELDIIADINLDETVNVQDITLLIERILYPDSYAPENLWDFETEWDGEDNYMFIHYDPSNNNSVVMWDDDFSTNICPSGSDRLTLLEKS